MKPHSIFKNGVLLMLSLAAMLSAPLSSAAIGAESKKPTGQAASKSTEPVLSLEEQRKRTEWQNAMSQVPVPKKGCFKSTYPSLEWQEVPCGQPSKFQNPPASGLKPNVVGNGNDISAVVSGAKISQAIGSFDSVTPATVTETGPWGGNANKANAFTLQINSQFFSTPACNSHAGCIGWEQFIYSQNQCSGPCVFMEYWLINYGPTCPSATWNQSGNSCWFNSASTSAAAVTAKQLQGTTLKGTASNTTDTVVLTSPGGTATATAADSVVSLAAQWTTAEFNIFGDCCSSQANFGAGTTAVTRIRVINGGTAAPTCSAQGFTAETNNLSFGPGAPATSAPGPALIFNASSAGGAPSNCGAATGVGDTHLTTFSGLLYDFQASGDFVLADAGPEFVVQSRQVSGAPTWPNAAVNSAVAAQLGKTTVAICARPKRLVVDGRTVKPRGRGLALADGAQVTWAGNTYIIRNGRGDSVVATLNSPNYIDVTVGLGQWPEKVEGLLANPKNDVSLLATREGRILKTPFAFEEIYHPYAESWRVDPNASLLSVCGREVKTGIPDKPFYAKDLNREQTKLAQAICARAGVEKGPLLDACVLDVAVIGKAGAAKIHAKTLAPTATAVIQ
ncbi:hypothetical protein ACVDG8_006555 [Mesorhizobium sp. ORM8.1]